MAFTDDILALIRTALDEFDDRPLQVSVRRAVRIAGLIGDSRAAVRLAHELMPSGGDPQANASSFKQLMADSSTWGNPDGPAEDALREYFRDRARADDPKKPLDPNTSQIYTHSLDMIQFWSERAPQLPDYGSPQELDFSRKHREIQDRTRYRTFSYLCAWERRFGYASINESIFGDYKTIVDKLLAEGVPTLIEQFNAVYRRLNEAATADPERPASEELSQAITTCRRILEAVVDHVLPPQDQPSDSGHKLDQPSYRNRLFEFIKRANDSKSVGKMTVALSKGLHERFESVDELTNKGVHASMALRAGNLCALNTYILCGEILLLKAETEKAS
ncbi:hypothetical protein [Streptomyces sp. CA-106110]|uniref:hypothetical protein n=1 Tax=Streptomyces sp. CA-106110 TaxID=3240044 RepID=UPI003D8ABCF4